MIIIRIAIIVIIVMKYHERVIGFACLHYGLPWGGLQSQAFHRENEELNVQKKTAIRYWCI